MRIWRGRTHPVEHLPYHGCMLDGDPTSYVLVFRTGRADIVPIVEEALRSAGIPYHSGLQAEPVPQVVFSVPTSRLEEAQAIVGQYFGMGPLASDQGDEAAEVDRHGASEEEEPRLPWGPIRVCLFLVLVHLSIVFGLVGGDPTSKRLAAAGGLVGGLGLLEPWRLVTYLFVHSDPRHALWNGLSMVVFAVPLVEALGYARTGAIYLVSGIAGGSAALLAYPPGTVTVGSSGAVAGLFGAWLVRTLRKARRAPPNTRARLRVIGIGLLVLPTLLAPTTDDGTRISVVAHAGGALAGALLGLISFEHGSAARAVRGQQPNSP